MDFVRTNSRNRKQAPLAAAFALALVGAAAHAQPRLDLPTPGQLANLRVGQPAEVTISLSNLPNGTELTYLAARIDFGGSFIGQPTAILRGAIVPSPLNNPLDFVSTATDSDVDVSFLTFGTLAVQHIRTNGVFARLQILPVDAGTGQLTFTFVDALRYDTLSPTGGSPVGLVAGVNVAYTVGYANDDCATATAIGDGLFSCANTLATSSGPDEPVPFGAADPAVNADRWWLYTAPVGGTVKVATCGASFDTRVVIYPATCPTTPGHAIASNDDACGLASSLFFAATQGGHYLVRVGGRGPARGTGTLAITGCPADIDDGSGTGTRDGGVTIDDLLYYLHLFGLGLVAADFDDGSGTGARDGGVTLDDLLYFLNAYQQGC